MNEMFSGKITKADRKRDAFKRLTEEAKGRGIDRKFARMQIRKAITNNRDSAPSQFSGIASRRERKALAKLNGVPFTPQYNY